MSNTPQQIETFRDYAKKQLKEHTLELETLYQNRQMASSDLKQQAYKEHRQLFEKELANKMEELLIPDKHFLRPALTGLKERFIEKLKHQA